MKKHLILLYSLVVVALSSNAQTTEIGVRGGFDLSNLSISESQQPTTSFKNRPSFLAGGFATFRLSDEVGFQPELLYSSNGSKLSTTGVGTATIKTGYLSLPIYFRVNATKNFHILFGSYVSYLLSATQSSVDVKDQLKSMDFGWAFGLGYDFEKKFNVGVRYNIGLYNIDKNSTLGLSATNTALQFVVGYKLFTKQ